MLRAEAEEDDAAMPHWDFGERDLVFEIFRAEQPAGTQQMIGGIARDDVDALRVCHLEGGAVNEIDVHILWETVRQRLFRVNLNSENRAGTVKGR